MPFWILLGGATAALVAWRCLRAPDRVDPQLGRSAAMPFLVSAMLDGVELTLLLVARELTVS